MVWSWSDSVDHDSLPSQVLEVAQTECVRAPAFANAYVPKEGALSIDFDHPNVIATFKMVTENVPGMLLSVSRVPSLASHISIPRNPDIPMLRLCNLNNVINRGPAV